jgi:hypothetical protein
MKVKTYNPKKIVASLGNHSVTGPAEGSWITLEQGGDGVTKVVGAYGEVQRSISPDETYNIKLTLLWGSPTNEWLRRKLKQDRADSNAIFPVLIKDLVGNTVFSAEEAWVAKDATINYDLTAQALEWTLETGQAETTGGSIL